MKKTNLLVSSVERLSSNASVAFEKISKDSVMLSG